MAARKSMQCNHHHRHHRHHRHHHHHHHHHHHQGINQLKPSSVIGDRVIKISMDSREVNKGNVRVTVLRSSIVGEMLIEANTSVKALLRNKTRNASRE